jgi:cysteine desulfurase
LLDIADTLVNGPKNLDRRLPNNINVSFVGIEGESIVLRLDMAGIAVITGSACFSRSLEPSYVMKAMGYSHERSHGSVRFTLSRYTQEQSIEKVKKVCKETVESLRKISPIKS